MIKEALAWTSEAGAGGQREMLVFTEAHLSLPAPVRRRNLPVVPRMGTREGGTCRLLHVSRVAGKVHRPPAVGAAPRQSEPQMCISHRLFASAGAAVARGPQMQEDRFAYKTSCGYDIEAPYWAKNGGVFGWPDVIWAREAEVKHSRIAMLAATGLIVQDLFTLPFYGKWYTGEKVWALHDKLVKIGAAWQVLIFLFLLEIPFISKAVAGTLDGTGDYGFDPLGLKSDRRAVVEIKNGRLAMIAFGGMMQHYLITGKGPVQFITQIPNFKSCALKASQLPGAKVASLPFFGKTLEVASNLCVN